MWTELAAFFLEQQPDGLSRRELEHGIFGCAKSGRGDQATEMMQLHESEYRDNAATLFRETMKSSITDKSDKRPKSAVMTEHGHPIEVDLERILPLLAREIYTSPFAFLRENVQNAFDAIRMQRYREKRAGVAREHKITIILDGNRLSISDTGIGMTKADLANFFWSIGKSGKHTTEAKSAGVVGTFGIGGMANFGVCSRLEVTTRTRVANETIISFANHDELSAKVNCVFYKSGPLTFEPGTTVTGTLIKQISSDEIIAYLEPIVRYLDVPIFVGNKVLSQKAFPSVIRKEGKSWKVK